MKMFRFTCWAPGGPGFKFFETWRRHFTDVGIDWEVRQRGTTFALFREGEDAMSEESKREVIEDNHYDDTVIMAARGR